MGDMKYEEFYAEVGKLFYALAKVNGDISEEERKELHRLILDKLVPLEDSTDEFGTDCGMYAEMEFEVLLEQGVKPKVAFNSFIDYVDNHFTAMNPKMKNAVIEISEALISKFHQRSIKDLHLLNKLRKTFSDHAL